MKAIIYTHRIPIGTTKLIVTDVSMGVLSGVLEPNQNYLEVQSVLQACNDEDTDKDGMLKSLRLSVQLENEYFLFPIGGIDIIDIRELGEGPIQIDIAGVHSHVIEDFFEKRGGVPVLHEPWEFVSIDQKIGFEDELRKEVGGYIRKGEQTHDLNGVSASALASTGGMNDDVLFAIHASSVQYRFVVVHLTWGGRGEQRNFPTFTYYTSFDDFINNRMYPDKVDWEM